MELCIARGAWLPGCRYLGAGQVRPMSCRVSHVLLQTAGTVTSAWVPGEGGFPQHADPSGRASRSGRPAQHRSRLVCEPQSVPRGGGTHTGSHTSLFIRGDNL